MGYYPRKKVEPIEGEALEKAVAKGNARAALVKSAESSEVVSREDRFITKLQASLEFDLGDSNSIDIKERNILYANCIKFLAVLTKFGGDEDDGSYWGKD